jgi:hypothetical protein
MASVLRLPRNKVSAWSQSFHRSVTMASFFAEVLEWALKNISTFFFQL